jgi:predicted permease
MSRRAPPRLSRFLLSLAVPRDQHDTVLGDLDEEYAERIDKGLGRVRGRLWYWRECASLSRAFLGDRARERSKHVGRARAAVRNVSKRSTRNSNTTAVRSNVNAIARKGRRTEMGVLLKDLVFGFRSLAKRPSSAVISVLVLSIGIGLSTFMFSIVYGVWLRGLDVPEADRLTMIFQTNLERDVNQRSVPVHDLYDWREQQRSFEGLAGWYSGTVNVSGGGEDPERFSGAFVTPNLFDVLRVQPILGRGFVEGDEQPGAPFTAILAYDVWQNRFGGEADVLGTVIKANGEQATIIGVMPEGYGFPNGEDIWIPMRDIPSQVERGQRSLSVMGRLNDGVTLQQAELELASIADGLVLQYPETNEGIGVRFVSWELNQTPMSFGKVFIVMLVSVIFVLMVACANVANLLLARATLRVKEAAVRTALGGSRMRVVLPFFAEAMLLAVGAAVLGTLIAFGGIKSFDALTMQFRPFWIEFMLDVPALLFVAGTAVVVSVFAGALPAYQIARSDVNVALKDESRGSSSFHLGKVSRALVVGEVALSCALLVGSGLMARSMINVSDTTFSYAADNVFTARVGLFPTVYPDSVARSRFFVDLQSRLESHPQIAHAALISHLPGSGASSIGVAMDGEEYQDDHDLPTLRRAIVSPGLFGVLGVSLLQGREFTADDVFERPPVAIVNQWFAARHFDGGSPLGRRFREGNSSDAPWITIVGVAPDLDLNGVVSANDSAGYYLPLAQRDQRFISIIASPVGGGPMALTAEVRRTVRALDDDLPIYNVESLDFTHQQLTQFFGIFGVLFILFGVITMAMSLVGLYGVLSFSVNRRIQEMGVRIALGARGRDVVRLILRQGVIQIGIGMTIGLAAAAGVSRVLGNFLVGVQARDPVVFGGVTLLVIGIGLFATWLPARRASGIDPMVALRAE